MIGDGLNDAGALAAADVGIAVSDETACLVPACDALLRGDRVAALPAVLALRAAGPRGHRAVFRGVGRLQRRRPGAGGGGTAHAARQRHPDAGQLAHDRRAQRRADAPARPEARAVSIIGFLIAAGGLVAGGFLAAFIWAVRDGQFDDTTTPAVRVLLDDARPTASPKAAPLKVIAQCPRAGRTLRVRQRDRPALHDRHARCGGWSPSSSA